MCFVDLEKSFDHVPRKVMEWALRKKGLPEMFVIAMMSLYEGAKTKVRVGTELSEEVCVKIVYIKDQFCLHCYLLSWLM